MITKGYQINEKQISYRCLVGKACKVGTGVRGRGKERATAGGEDSSRSADGAL